MRRIREKQSCFWLTLCQMDLMEGNAVLTQIGYNPLANDYWLENEEKWRDQNYCWFMHLISIILLLQIQAIKVIGSVEA